MAIKDHYQRFSCITSRDQSRNAHDVPYREILEAHKLASKRLVKALTAALKAWAKYDAARRSKRAEQVEQRKALHDKAVELTRIALL